MIHRTNDNHNNKILT